MKMLNKIFAAILIFGVASPTFAYSTLWEYFVDTQGRLPSVSERAPLAEEIGIKNYSGTAEQNIKWLSILDGDSFEIVEDLGDTLVLSGFSPTGGGTYRLKNSIGTTDTSLPLSSFKEPVSNNLYTMAYMNATVAYGTIDPSTTRSEFVSFTGITQNSDGSATLTGVSRGLTRTPAGSSCTASTTLAQRHPGQSVFILSDSPCFFAEYPVKRNDETITGSWSFPSPTTGANPATKTYVDGVVSGGTVTYDSVTVAGTAGETIATGTIVYFNKYDTEWMKADADTASTTHGIMIGVAQGAGTNGISISGGVLIYGLDKTNTGGTAGTRIYLSGTAGATSTTAGTFTRVLGYMRSSTNFYFDPFMGAFNENNQINPNLLNTASYTLTGTTTVTASKFVDENDQRKLSTTTIYSTAGTHTWTKPTGARSVCLLLVGGGAGGITGNGNPGGGGGGGGGMVGGCYAAARATTTEYILVGAGGATASAGATTTFSTFISAPGGYAGSGATGGIGGTYTLATNGGDIGLNGGNGGAGGTYSGGPGAGGGGGSAGGTVGVAGTNGPASCSANGGAGGVAPTNDTNLGNGGKGDDVDVENGTVGANYGGGGGGGSYTATGEHCTITPATTGKAGAGGLVIVTTFF